MSGFSLKYLHYYEKVCISKVLFNLEECSTYFLESQKLQVVLEF